MEHHEVAGRHPQGTVEDGNDTAVSGSAGSPLPQARIRYENGNAQAWQYNERNKEEGGIVDAEIKPERSRDIDAELNYYREKYMSLKPDDAEYQQTLTKMRYLREQISKLKE